MNQQQHDRRPEEDSSIYFPPPGYSNQSPYFQPESQGHPPVSANYPSSQYSQERYSGSHNYQYQQPPVMSPVHPPVYPPSVPQKWYRTNAGIIAMLIIFFPIGLYLMWKYANWPKNAKLVVTGILALCVLLGGIANAASSTQQGSPASAQTQTQQASSASTQSSLPTSAPTPQTVHYPPTTVADLHGLAAKGDASAIHEFHSESVGMTGACPQPKREVTVDPSVTGQQLAEDLLAYFYDQQLDSPCGSIVFAYHTQAEANNTFTAGRINLDVADSSGAPNVDPNASNLKYTLTLDVGGDSTGQEYVVTY